MSYRRYWRKRLYKITTRINKEQFKVLLGCLVIVMAGFFIGVSQEDKIQEDEEDYIMVTPIEAVNVEPVSISEILTPPVIIPTEVVTIVTPEATPEPEPEIEAIRDPNNSIYPFNTMSADWGVELYESGFKVYEIPERYIENGGCFPEVVQAYLWCLCEERGLDYYMVVALIERESWYKWSASGDDGNSKGYMQIYEKWHTDRMGEEGAEDLFNPYQNIRVGLNFLQELTARSYGDNHYVLMSYNMGESKCKEYNKKGIYSTKYSRGILQRAQEIKQELQD